jgi:hypothetical protein
LSLVSLFSSLYLVFVLFTRENWWIFPVPERGEEGENLLKIQVVSAMMIHRIVILNSEYRRKYGTDTF